MDEALEDVRRRATREGWVLSGSAPKATNGAQSEGKSKLAGLSVF